MNRELDFIKDMFDGIAVRYDFLNHLLSMGQDLVWRTHMVKAAGLEKDSCVLDIACGTGDVTAEIIKQTRGNVRILGVDFSMNMLRIAKKKLGIHDTLISWIQGNALCLPVPDTAFHGLFIAFGIRNIMQKDQVLAEFYRVLKPNGKVVILELATPGHIIMKKLYFLYFCKILPKIGSFFSKDDHAYSYLPASVIRFPRQEEIIKMMGQAGFRNLRFKTMTFGIVSLFVGEK